MSILGRKISLKAVAALAAVMVVVALLPVWTSAPEREIRLVVRGMAFYLEGDPRTANPTLEVRAGETVRVVLVNDERGVTHDFVVPELRASTALIDWNESDAVTFDVPSSPGSYEYICQPHRLMMRGTIQVH